MTINFSLIVGLLFQTYLPNTLISKLNHFNQRTQPFYPIISLFIIAAAITGTVLVTKYVFHSFMNSADEHSCYFLAKCILDGKLWATPPPLSHFFDVVHIGNKAGKWFSVYPPGWPLLFAFGIKINQIDWINPILSGISLCLFYLAGKHVFNGKVSFYALLITSFTPFFIFNNATYHSHATCLLAISLFIFSFLKAQEGKWPIFWWTLSAIACGYGLGTRYLTMAAIAAPFIAFELFYLLSKRKKATVGHFMFGLVLLGAITLNLYFNYLITGHFFDPPNHFHHRWERLGFQRYDYMPWHAVLYIFARIFYLMDWAPSVWMIFYLVSITRKFEWKGNETLFQFSMVFLALAYSYYYSWGGHQYGPRYYLEGLPFMALAASRQIEQWWKRDDVSLQKYLVGIIVASIFITCYLFGKHVIFYEKATRERASLYELAKQTLRTPSIVFIRGLLGNTLVMSPDDTVRNDPVMDKMTLYAHDKGSENMKLLSNYQNRRGFLGYYDVKQNKPVIEPIEIERTD